MNAPNALTEWITSTIIRLALIAFAFFVWSSDRNTAIAIVAVVGGHALGVSSTALGNSLTPPFVQINKENAAPQVTEVPNGPKQ